MSSNYLHGSETKESNAINLTIQDADISNVCIIGTSPVITNDIPHINNFRESKTYVGDNITGFTLPDATETVLNESGGASIYVINIYDRAKHSASIEKSITLDESYQCKLDEIDIQNLILSQTIDEETTVLTLNVHYKYENNVITFIQSSLETFNNIKASYSYADFSKITDSDVIGETDAQGKRSGAQKIYDIIATYGITPGIIIAPGFTSKNVRTAIQTIVDDIEAFTYLDCDKNTTVPLAERARLNPVDGIDLTSNHERTYLAQPWVYRYNQHEDKDILQPYSPVLAGQRVRLDRERNIAKSISNTISKTTKATQYPISFVLNKQGTDSNRLNAIGIGTVINEKGEHYTWGNRNTSYPKNDGLMTFESARRTRDFINKSIRDTSFICIDENITQGYIDDVLNMINNAFAKWKNPADKENYIIYDGEAYWDESLNTAENISKGHIYFPYKCCPLAIAERITFEDILDITIITKTLNT